MRHGTSAAERSYSNLTETPEHGTQGLGPDHPLVITGRREDLGQVPFHRDGPLARWLMAGAALSPDLNCHIAVHEFTDVAEASREYCDPHVHEFDEINVFHSSTGLRVALTLGDDTTDIEAPATVFIPAGTPHAANVISGSGVMVAFLLSGQFRATDGR